MNIPSDEVLAEAAKYANEQTQLQPQADDVETARSVFSSRFDNNTPWAHYVREFCAISRSVESTAFDTYQRSAMSLAYYPGRGTGDLSYPALGLNGETTEAMAKVLASFASGDEHATAPALMATILACVSAGRVSEHAKKALRDDDGKLTEERRKAVLKELGDVLWYVTACATEAGFSLREVAEANLAKLHDRAARGKLGGSGDER